MTVARMPTMGMPVSRVAASAKACDSHRAKPDHAEQQTRDVEVHALPGGCARSNAKAFVRYCRQAGTPAGVVLPVLPTIAGSLRFPRGRKASANKMKTTAAPADGTSQI